MSEEIPELTEEQRAAWQEEIIKQTLEGLDTVPPPFDFAPDAFRVSDFRLRSDIWLSMMVGMSVVQPTPLIASIN